MRVALKVVVAGAILLIIAGTSIVLLTGKAGFFGQSSNCEVGFAKYVEANDCSTHDTAEADAIETEYENQCEVGPWHDRFDDEYC